MADRTLIVSDLHIGMYDGYSLLQHRDALELLLNEVERCSRLVLLGDVVELKQAQARHSWPIAQPILRMIAARLGSDREVLFLPGNHDHLLVRGWAQAQGRELKPEAVVPADASPLLTEVVAALAPARVEVRYPAMWLNERVWLHHGHYLNSHLFPRTAYGFATRRGRSGKLGSSSPEDYEPQHSAPRPPVTRLLPQRARAGVEGVEDLARARTAPGPADPIPGRWHDLIHPKLSPAISMTLGTQMRLHSVPAVAQVAHNLGAHPDWLVFGHVHRRGPMDGDNTGEWKAGNTRMINTGSWRWERILVEGASAPHPYWPGGAVVIEGDQDPRSVGLLDELSEEEIGREAARIRAR